MWTPSRFVEIGWRGLLIHAAGACAVLALSAVLLSRFGLVFIGGWSMSPAYLPGDLAIYQKAPVRPQPGEPVLVVGPKSPRGFVHRVVALRPDGSCETKGDASEHEDFEPAPREHIAGRIVAAVPTGHAMDSLVRVIGWCYNRVPIANTRL